MSEERTPQPEATEPCTCPVAGYCSRFRMNMTDRTKHLCETSADYRWAFGGRVGPKPSDLLTPIPVELECVYRGDAIGLEPCVPCSNEGKSVAVPVYRCPKAKQGRCSLDREVRDAGTCNACLSRRSAAVDRVLRNTTVCVTHWKRPKALARLLASLERFYPDLPVLVEDTGGNLSAARNRLAARCETEFYAMFEEDMELTVHSRLERLAEVLAENPDVGGASGAVMEKRKGVRQRIYWDKSQRWVDDAVYLVPNASPWQTTTGKTRWRRCESSLNLGIFRTELFRSIGWDENLPVQEHSEFLARLWWDGRWALAYVPSFVVEHHRDDRSKEYNAGRGRRFWEYLNGKHGVRFLKETPPIPRSPNVVVLGVGRSNSSVVTKMLARQYDLHAGEFNAEEYAENRLFHEACVDALRTGKLDPVKARRALRSLPEPWILKDPRLRTLLPLWLPYFEPFAPKLVYVTKDPAAVKASHDRAGWSKVYREENAEKCEAYFAAWPWAKERFDAADLNEAVKLWDCDRFEESIRRGQEAIA